MNLAFLCSFFCLNENPSKKKDGLNFETGREFNLLLIKVPGFFTCINYFSESVFGVDVCIIHANEAWLILPTKLSLGLPVYFFKFWLKDCFLYAI